MLGAERASIAILAAEPRRPPLGATSPEQLEVSVTTPSRTSVNLRAQGRDLGSLEVVDRPEREFTPRDDAILTQLGQLAAGAIANARLYGRERTIARTLQRSLRPGELPAVPGLAAAVRFNAAGEGVELGGDFYDLFRGRDGGWAALIGDIQGKGPEAAAVTALARHTLRAAAAYEHRPSGVLTLLHRELREQVADGRFCTVAYAYMQVVPGHVRLELACGGHPLPLIVHQDGTVEEVGRLGTLLGLGRRAAARRHRGRARARRRARLLHRRRHGGPPPAPRGVRHRAADRAAAGLRRPEPGRGGRARRARGHARVDGSPARRHGRAGARAGPRCAGRRLSHLRTRRRPPRRNKPQRRAMADTPDATATDGHGEATADLLKELVSHLRANRTQLREEWARRISDTRLLTALTQEEIFSEATSIYDSYVGVLETGSVEALQDYARNLSERIIPRGVEVDEVVGIVLLLRDVLARSLFEKYQADFGLLNRVLDAYEPAANRIANTVAGNFVGERERVIRQQQEAIRELSTPVLQVRERLLILPIIGVLDGQRARQLTEQLLRGIRANRAKVVVIDITGVPTIDSTVANHLVQTVEASRLMGASVIITGLSSDIAQTLVTLGVDLSKVNAVGDLQGGIEEAERLLGYEVTQGDYLAPEGR